MGCESSDRVNASGMRMAIVAALSVGIVAVASRPVHAATAEELVDKYSTFLTPIIEKYYPDRKQFIRDLDRIISGFKRIKARAKNKEPFRLKIGSLAPEGTAWVAQANDFINPFTYDVSGGSLKIVMYTGGVMGEDRDVLRKMKLGQMHGCGCTAEGILSVAPELSVFSLPFLFRDYSEVDYILGRFRKDIESILDKKGLILSSLIDTGYFYVFLKNKVTTLDEMKKQKFITWFGDMESAFLGELGIQPIPISVPEVVMSLRSGMANAGFSPPAWFLGTQAYLSANYFIEQPFFYSIAAVVLQKDAMIKNAEMNGLTRGDTDEITRLSARLNRMLRLETSWNTSVRSFEKQSLKAFLDYGIKPLRLSDEDMHLIEQAGLRVREKMAGRMYPRELYDRIIHALDEYRKGQIAHN